MVKNVKRVKETKKLDRTKIKKLCHATPRNYSIGGHI